MLASSLVLALCVAARLLYESTTYSFLAYANTSARTSSRAAKKTQDQPVATFIYIPSLEVGLPIEEASVAQGLWGYTPHTASHLSSSAQPGEKSNVVLYASNTLSEFGLLTSLQKGDEILVDMKNGDTLTYYVSDLEVVLPTETQVIGPTDKETLTLYTPYGFAGLHRFVVKAMPAVTSL